MRYRFRHHPSKMATLIATFGCGSRMEYNSKYPKGIAHFLEHVLFKATKRYTAKQLLWKVASIGGYWNACTSEDLVSYYISFPEENIATALECLSEIVDHPTFPADELEKEKEVICQEVRMYQDEISELVHYSMMDSVFNHSLASPIVGSEESVRSVTREHILDYYKNYYSSDHKLIVLCAAKDYKDDVETYFGKIDDKLIWKPRIEPNYKSGVSKEVIKEGQLQHIIDIGFAGGQIDSAAKDRAKVEVFNKILGGSDVSRLFLKIREDMALVYGISSGMMDAMDGNMFSVSTQTEPENSAQVIEEINNQIKLITETLPTKEELASAKNKIRSAEYSAADSSSRTAHRITYEEFYNYPNVEKRLEEINKVTPEEVRDTAQKIFNGSNKYMIIGHGGK